MGYKIDMEKFMGSVYRCKNCSHCTIVEHGKHECGYAWHELLCDVGLALRESCDDAVPVLR